MPSTFDVGRLQGRAFSLGLPHKMIDDLTISLPGCDPGHEVKGLPVANTSLSKSRRVGGKPISNGSIPRSHAVSNGRPRERMILASGHYDVSQKPSLQSSAISTEWASVALRPGLGPRGNPYSVHVDADCISQGSLQPSGPGSRHRRRRGRNHPWRGLQEKVNMTRLGGAWSRGMSE
jgi:hypothetical protein